jgi:hypothetical protein
MLPQYRADCIKLEKGLPLASSRDLEEQMRSWPNAIKTCPLPPCFSETFFRIIKTGMEIQTFRNDLER